MLQGMDTGPAIEAPVASRTARGRTEGAQHTGPPCIKGHGGPIPGYRRRVHQGSPTLNWRQLSQELEAQHQER